MRTVTNVADILSEVTSVVAGSEARAKGHAVKIQ
jgi:hypothetical protein